MPCSGPTKSPDAFYTILGAALALVVLAVAPSLTTAAPLSVATERLVRKSPGAEVSIAYPHTGDGPIDRAIEAYVREEVDGLGSSREDDPDAARPYTLDLRFDVARNDDRFFVVMFTGYVDTGGAHPNWGGASFNFLRRGGGVVRLLDLVDADRGARRISEDAIAQLTRTLGERADTTWIGQGAGADLDNFSLFEWLPNELRIFLPPYQVASHADGVQVVRIPMDQLRDVIVADPQPHAASFDCSKAGSTSEKAVCANAALRGLDHDLGQAYCADLRAARSPGAKAALQGAQRQWLAERDRTCAGDHACLAKTYRLRLRALVAR